MLGSCNGYLRIVPVLQKCSAPLSLGQKMIWLDSITNSMEDREPGMLWSKVLDMDCTVQRIEHELETEQQHGHYSCHLNIIPKGSVCLFVF